MKKFLCLLLVAVLLLLCGCIADKKDKPDAVLQEYLDNIDQYGKPVKEYGSPASHIDMSEEIAIGIMYPETEAAFLNKAINQWIVSTVGKYTEEAESTPEGKGAAELTFSYESFMADEFTASIVMKGTYFAPYMAHPEDIVKVFNADLKAQEIFTVDKLFGEKGLAKFIELVVNKTGVRSDDVDAHFLDNSYLTKDNLVVVLERGAYLPMSDGTKTVVFEYTEIADLLKKTFEEQEKVPPEDEKLPDIKTDSSEKNIAPDKPMIALTFDDGPSAHTDRLLDIFAKNGGKGTFFVVGNLIDSRKSTMIRLVSEGHEIGNHSWNHRQLTNLSDEEVKDQIMMTRAKIYDVTGVDCRIVRPPYGACNDSVRAVGAKLGVSYVNWSVDTLDWKTKNADAVYSEIMKDASDGAIILCHDLHKTTVDAMERVIPKLIAQGYQLVTVSQLMECKGKALEAGKMYYKG